MLSQEQTLRRVNSLITNDPPPVFLIGAGASWPHLPTADALKRSTLRILAGTADIQKPDFETWCDKIVELDHLTLEVFYALLRYRCGIRFDPVDLWGAIASDAPISATTEAVVSLAWKADSPAILTTNFDTTIYRALR